VYFSGLESEDGGVERHQVPLTGPIQAQAGLQSLRNLGNSDQKNGSKGNLRANASAGLNANEWLYWDSNEEIFSVFKSLSKVSPVFRFSVTITAPSMIDFKWAYRINGFFPHYRKKS
jgi:hypothetical protein